VRGDIATGCDLVVLNKCGKLEAAGGGLRDAFAPTDAGKALSFSAAGPVNGRRWRLPGMQTRFAIAQNAQDSNRGVDAAGNLVNVG
jgi:Protein of unknown function (DUF2478)